MRNAPIPVLRFPRSGEGGGGGPPGTVHTCSMSELKMVRCVAGFEVACKFLRILVLGPSTQSWRTMHRMKAAGSLIA